jgi:hypothetical protein
MGAAQRSDQSTLVEKYHDQPFTSGCINLVSVAATMCLLVAAAQAADNASEPKVKVDDNSFKCITDMTPVRHFYVDNLLGNVEATAAVEKAGKGVMAFRVWRWTRLASTARPASEARQLRSRFGRVILSATSHEALGEDSRRGRPVPLRTDATGTRAIRPP